ncbi:MAG TPA: Yip1 family protein [Verrucomicrobiae bacterium]|nr:Yip1 family protein [Verrucomicrobiae bacterium]
MIECLLLIFRCEATWDRLIKARLSVAAITIKYLLPLLVITSAGEAYGLMHWGKWRGTVAHLETFAVKEVVVFEAGQFVLTLMTVFITAAIVKSLGETFHGRHTYTQSFTAVAYALSPLYTLRLLDAFAVVSPWLVWGVGVVLSVGILYHGLPRAMLPDPPQAFGLYLVSALMLIMITGVVRFITAWYLSGHFSRLEDLILRFVGVSKG